MELTALRQFFAKRQTAYRNVFDNPEGRKVLADLAMFCRATTTTFHADPRLHALAEGRREVWLRIANHLHLTDDQMVELVTQGKTPKE